MKSTFVSLAVTVIISHKCYKFWRYVYSALRGYNKRAFTWCSLIILRKIKQQVAFAVSIPNVARKTDKLVTQGLQPDIHIMFRSRVIRTWRSLKWTCVVYIHTRILSQRRDTETHIDINYRITLFVTESTMTPVATHYLQGNTHGEVSRELRRIPIRVLDVTMLHFVPQFRYFSSQGSYFSFYWLCFLHLPLN